MEEVWKFTNQSDILDNDDTTYSSDTEKAVFIDDEETKNERTENNDKT
jgi:hypothetical protein